MTTTNAAYLKALAEASPIELLRRLADFAESHSTAPQDVIEPLVAAARRMIDIARPKDQDGSSVVLILNPEQAYIAGYSLSRAKHDQQYRVRPTSKLSASAQEGCRERIQRIEELERVFEAAWEA